MYRRRRISKEIAFSFDSFLDLVANVCGIIIRLILVAWVGARSYHALAAKQELESQPPTVVTATLKRPAPEMPPLSDPLEAELQRHRAELAEQQKRLLDQLRQVQELEASSTEEDLQLTGLDSSEKTAEQEYAQLKRQAADKANAAHSAQLSIGDLEKRTQRLAAELRELEKLPPLKKTLRYSTPVSRPVHSEELHFELQGGRVAFVDVQAFLIEIRRGMEDKAELLKSRWEVDGTAGPIGAFRMHYTLERERNWLDGATVSGAGDSFRYTLASWQVDPISLARGETAAEALAPGGQFRRLAEAIDPEQTVVTMWVYPDSFALYRQLRDYLHDHNVEVAGRPLPPGLPIASSRSGSRSRGQ